MAPTYLLVFDIDGTLLTTDEEQAFSDAFQELHGLVPDTDWESYRSCTDWGVACEILEEHFGRPPTDQEVQAGIDRFVALLARSIDSGRAPVVPVPGAVDFVRAAERGGFALSLATGCVKSSALLKVGALGLREVLPRGGFGDHRFDRASLLRDGIASAEAHHGVRFPPERTCYFGDRTWDVEGARELGIGFVGVAISDEVRAKLKRAGAERIVSDYAALGSPHAVFADAAGA